MPRYSKIEQLQSKLNHLVDQKQKKEYLLLQQEVKLAKLQSEIEKLKWDIQQIEQEISNNGYQY
jgi:predicted  nucleic acid-binding Zn-ribbon protein